MRSSRIQKNAQRRRERRTNEDVTRHVCTNTPWGMTSRRTDTRNEAVLEIQYLGNQKTLHQFFSFNAGEIIRVNIMRFLSESAH